MKPGLKKAVSTKSLVSARFRVRNDKFVDFERIVRRGPSSGMVRRVALSESLCKYTEKKYGEKLRQTDPAISVEDIVNDVLADFVESKKQISNKSLHPSMRIHVDLAVKRIIKKTPEIISFEKLSNDVQRAVGKNIFKSARQSSEELLVEALSKQGMIADTREHRQQTEQRRDKIRKVVRDALKKLTPAERRVFWDYLIKGKKLNEIQQSEKYKLTTKNGATSLQRVGAISITAKKKFIQAIETSGLFGKKK